MILGSQNQISAEPDIAEKTKNNAQPILTTERSTSDLHYSNHLIDVLGRKKEQGKLRKFIKGTGFQWSQLAGTGGQGKSRLAFDLVLECREDDKWNAGFLNDYYLDGFSSQWFEWQPEKPTLIVIDYAIGRESEIGDMLATLAERQNNKKNEFSYSVRVLLLERQPWNQSELPTQNEHKTDSSYRANVASGITGKAGWYLDLCNRSKANADYFLDLAKFEGGIIELNHLNVGDLVKIVNQIVELEGQKILSDDGEITNFLERIDVTGSPLYAYLFARSILSGNVKSNWSRDELLTDELVRMYDKRWAKKLSGSAPSIPSGSLSTQLAVFATMIEEVDSSELYGHGLWEGLTEQSAREAVVLADGYSRARAIAPICIRSMQPDILGEWFVLLTLSGPLKAKLTEMVSEAWGAAPEKFSKFMVHCSLDFPLHDSLTSILDVAPKTEAGWNAYVACSLELIAIRIYYDPARVPPNLLTAAECAADQGNASAKAVIGYCYVEGVGVDKDINRGLRLISEAADLNEPRAMLNLGLYLIIGEVVQADHKGAVEWLKKSADAGERVAKVALGDCYMKRIAGRFSFRKAYELYKDAAELGDMEGTFKVGRAYLLGYHVSQSAEKAAIWFKTAAEGGYAEAMFEYGVCLVEGKGVESNPKLGENWIEKAAIAGHSRAIEVLMTPEERLMQYLRD